MTLPSPGQYSLSWVTVPCGTFSCDMPPNPPTTSYMFQVRFSDSDPKSVSLYSTAFTSASNSSINVIIQKIQHLSTILRGGPGVHLEPNPFDSLSPTLGKACATQKVLVETLLILILLLLLLLLLLQYPHSCSRRDTARNNIQER